MSMFDSLNVRISPKQLDYVYPFDTGYHESVAKEDSSEAFCDAGFVEFPDALWIEPREWEEYAARNDELGTWGENYSNRFTNQSPTHECTTHCFLQCFEATWNMTAGGLFHPVWVSALNLYAEANPRQYGGASVRQIVSIAWRRGVLPENNGPDGQGTQKQFFRHTINCSSGNSKRDGGPWVSVSRFPEGWEETAAAFKPDKVINVRNWEQHFCLLLRGYVVGNGRAGHSIPHVRAVKQGGKWYSRYKDSYDVFRYDSIDMVKRGVGTAYCILTVNRPPRWAEPCVMRKPLEYSLTPQQRMKLATLTGPDRFSQLAV